jgi:hypothetical protein
MSRHNDTSTPGTGVFVTTSTTWVVSVAAPAVAAGHCTCPTQPQFSPTAHAVLHAPSKGENAGGKEKIDTEPASAYPYCVAHAFRLSGVAAASRHCLKPVQSADAAHLAHALQPLATKHD